MPSSDRFGKSCEGVERPGALGRGQPVAASTHEHQASVVSGSPISAGSGTISTAVLGMVTPNVVSTQLRYGSFTAERPGSGTGGLSQY
jgi:hypothetical protein